MKSGQEIQKVVDFAEVVCKKLGYVRGMVIHHQKRGMMVGCSPQRRMG
jgi:hypothetical protein